MGCLKLNIENPTLLKVLNGGKSANPKSRESSYWYGYQGSEKDDEIKGAGNSYTTEFRQLDPRIGRWWSPDPVFQPWQSPYSSMDNSPIRLNDPLGNVAGDYFDNMTGEKLGSDGVDDGLEYKIAKGAYDQATTNKLNEKQSPEQFKGELGRDAYDKSYNHQHSQNLATNGVQRIGAAPSAPIFKGTVQGGSKGTTMSPNDKAKKAMSTLSTANDLIAMAKDLPGLGTAVTIVDGAVKAGEIIDAPEGKKMETAKNVGKDLVVGTIISGLLTSKNPYGIALGAAMYVANELSNAPPVGPMSPEAQLQWMNTRDMDNTRILSGPGY